MEVTPASMFYLIAFCNSVLAEMKNCNSHLLKQVTLRFTFILRPPLSVWSFRSMCKWFTTVLNIRV